MKPYILLVLLAALASNPRCEVADRTSDTIPVTGALVINAWQPADGVLKALVEVGSQNHLPLGVVIQGDVLCSPQAASRNTTVTIGELVRQLRARTPTYTAAIEDGTLVVRPAALDAETHDVLLLRIPRFRTQRASLEEIGIGLWMNLRAVLIPSQGSAFVGGLQKGAEEIPPLDMSDVTVQSALNYIVTRGQGGIWIMHSVPKGWRSDPEKMRFTAISYSGDESSLRQVSCSDQDAFR